MGKLQLEDLNRLVSMVLDFFEDQTKRGWLVTMGDADAKLEEILNVNKRKMLKRFGDASAEEAERHAKAQYQDIRQGAPRGVEAEGAGRTQRGSIIAAALQEEEAFLRPRKKPTPRSQVPSS